MLLVVWLLSVYLYPYKPSYTIPIHHRQMHRMSKSVSCSRGSKRYEVRPIFMTVCIRTDMRQDAINLLNSRRRQARPQALSKPVEGTNRMPETPTFKGTPSIFNMKAWLHSLGHSVQFTSQCQVCCKLIEAG